MRVPICAGIMLAVASTAWSAPTPSALCEAALELASSRFASCRLVAESRFAKTGDASKRTEALGKCSGKLSTDFARAAGRYGIACAVTSPVAFDEYLTQCVDEASASAGGAPLQNDRAALVACEQDLASCKNAQPALLLRTGDVTNHGPGSDGALQLGVAHGFVDNGDGTVSDLATGLTWEKKSDNGDLHDKDNLYTWSTGEPWAADGSVFTTFLPALNAGGGFAGHTDWRLPNRRELQSLVNLAVASPATFAAFATACETGCDVLACSCTVGNAFYWTSTATAYSVEGAWTISFAHGVTPGVFKNATLPARAVRGGF